LGQILITDCILAQINFIQLLKYYAYARLCQRHGLFVLQQHCAKKSSPSAACQCFLRISAPHFNTSKPQCLHHIAHDLTSGWSLRKMENWLFLGTKTHNCCRANNCLLGCERVMENFLVRFAPSLSCSAPCATGQTTIYTGCDPALLYGSSSRLQPLSKM